MVLTHTLPPSSHLISYGHPVPNADKIPLHLLAREVNQTVACVLQWKENPRIMVHDGVQLSRGFPDDWVKPVYFAMEPSYLQTRREKMTATIERDYELHGHSKEK